MRLVLWVESTISAKPCRKWYRTAVFQIAREWFASKVPLRACAPKAPSATAKKQMTAPTLNQLIASSYAVIPSEVEGSQFSSCRAKQFTRRGGSHLCSFVLHNHQTFFDSCSDYKVAL